MLKKKNKKKKERKQKQKQSHKNYKEDIGTKLITNTKKHKLKIQNSIWNFRYTMLFKRIRERNREKEQIKKGHRNYIQTKTKTKLQVQN